MNFDPLKDFRNPDAVKGYAKIIHEICEKNKISAGIMEVCGGHTHTIARHSLESLLPQSLHFIHGPGCPVCILPKNRVDHAVYLAGMKDVILVTTGDMIRVPGSEKSLEKARSEGCDIRTVYNPLDVLGIAEENTDKIIIYFAIGFETTIPSTALLIKKSAESKLNNVQFYTNHVLVPPVLEALLSDPEHGISGFIAPAHVSVVTGSEIYKPLAEIHSLPVVVSGFEPVDIMQSVYLLVKQISENRNDLEVQYSRCVSPEGSAKCRNLIDAYFMIEDEFEWRGPGIIKKSSLCLRPEYDSINAAVIYRDSLPKNNTQDYRLCLCSEILKGKKRPSDCGVFRKRCTPDNPLGACMVSGEGACAAYYKYGKAS